MGSTSLLDCYLEGWVVSNLLKTYRMRVLNTNVDKEKSLLVIQWIDILEFELLKS